MLILEPEERLREELAGATAQIWSGSRAMALGPWAASGPILLVVGGGSAIEVAEVEPDRIVRVVEPPWDKPGEASGLLKASK